MDKLESTFEKASNPLSVTVFESGILKDGEHVGKVQRDIVSLDNLIAGIIEEHSGLDPYVIQHSANLLKDQMLKMISHGKGINLLGMGTLYIGLNGTVKGQNPKSADIPDLKLKFTPSPQATDALKNVVIDTVVFSNNSPKINTITDIWTNAINSTLTIGKFCTIKGKNLKLGGDSYSLSFIKQDETGHDDFATSPTPVPLNKFFKNTKTTLQFFVPDTLEPNATYKIRISTSYVNKYKSRKTPLVTDSDSVTVVEDISHR